MSEARHVKFGVLINKYKYYWQVLCMYVCMYESIYNAPLLQPKQSRVRARRPNRKDVFSLLQNSLNVSLWSRSDDGREFHSFGAQAAKLRGQKLEVR